MSDKPSQSILEEAGQIAGTGDRARDYGHPLDNFARIAKAWEIVFGHPVTEEQVGWCMIGVKLAREVNSPKRDNLVDVCGYAKCIEMLGPERERRKNTVEKSMIDAVRGCWATEANV